MNLRAIRLGLAGILAAGLLTAGCLISITLILVDTFSFTTASQFYFYEVDVTDEPDWEDNKDKIDFIDAVGFEFYITNNQNFEVTFDVWVDDHGQPQYTTVPQVEANTDQIINDLKVPASTANYKVTYAQSLAVLSNLEKLKALAKTGQLHYYGLASGGTFTSAFRVDSAKVIITVSASK